jgi:hypothetical protein
LQRAQRVLAVAAVLDTAANRGDRNQS